MCLRTRYPYDVCICSLCGGKFISMNVDNTINVESKISAQYSRMYNN